MANVCARLITTLLTVNCIAMAHFSFCREPALDDYVSARPISYFKTIYNTYIDTATYILGMLHILLNTAASCYLHYITNYNNTIHQIRELSGIVEKYIYFSLHQCLTFSIVSDYLTRLAYMLLYVQK